MPRHPDREIAEAAMPGARPRGHSPGNKRVTANLATLHHHCSFLMRPACDLTDDGRGCAVGRTMRALQLHCGVARQVPSLFGEEMTPAQQDPQGCPNLPEEALHATRACCFQGLMSTVHPCIWALVEVGV